MLHFDDSHGKLQTLNLETKSFQFTASFWITWNGTSVHYAIIILQRKHNSKLVMVDENGIVHYKMIVWMTYFDEIINLHPSSIVTYFD